MKNLLKYLLPFVAIVAFCGAASGFCASSDESEPSCLLPIETGVCQASFTTTGSAVCVPTQVSCTGSVRAEESARRTEHAHKSHFVFVKSGKIISSGIGHSVHKNGFVISTAVTEHAHKLIYLGKLIL